MLKEFKLIRNPLYAETMQVLTQRGHFLTGIDAVQLASVMGVPESFIKDGTLMVSTTARAGWARVTGEKDTDFDITIYGSISLCDEQLKKQFGGKIPRTLYILLVTPEDARD